MNHQLKGWKDSDEPGKVVINFAEGMLNAQRSRLCLTVYVRAFPPTQWEENSLELDLTAIWP